MAKKKIVSFNIINEQVVIANMIKSNKVRRRLTKDLTSDVFIGIKHKSIFKILSRMAEKNLEFDIDTFESLAKDSEEFGGLSYIQKIEDVFDENANIDHHVELLKTDYVKNLIKTKKLGKLADMIEDPHTTSEDLHQTIKEIEKQIIDNYNSGKLLSGMELRKSYWKDLQERKKASNFVPTGIKGLDKWLTEGLARKKCSIWSARPGMGKSTTIANITLNLIRGIKNSKGEIICEPKKVLLVPLETGHMSVIDIMISILVKEQLEKELLDDNSGLPKSMIGMPLDVFTKDTDKIVDYESYIKKAMKIIFENDNLTVTDNPRLTLTELEIILQEGNYDVCLMDLWERLSDIDLEANRLAKKLTHTQAIAKECNVHMGIVQQQRRADAKSKSKKPTMEALKNSGAYEEIADLIVFMYRAKYYNPELDEDIIEYIIGKQRRGVMNKVGYHEFHGKYGVIGDYRKNYSEEVEEEDF